MRDALYATVRARSAYPDYLLHRQRIGFLRIDLPDLDRARDVLGAHLAFDDERRDRGLGDVIAVDLEEAAQVFARVAAAETVAAEHGILFTLGHERADLVGVLAHVIG